MASTEELEAQILAEMESNPEAYADTGTEYCTVDDDTRLVTIPDKYKKFGVESDEKVKRIWFRFPKLVGNNGVDLSAIGVRVNFQNANGDRDIYMVEDLTVDGDYVIFSWELSRKVTAYKGHISFVVCAVKSSTTGVVKNEWNTTLNKDCEVLEGLEVTEQIAQENPDIIEYILANLGGSYTLPIATSEALGGVKPVSKTDAMTQEVGVDSEGKLYTEPTTSSGGSGDGTIADGSITTEKIVDGAVTPEKTAFFDIVKSGTSVLKTLPDGSKSKGVDSTYYNVGAKYGQIVFHVSLKAGKKYMIVQNETGNTKYFALATFNGSKPSSDYTTSMIWLPLTDGNGNLTGEYSDAVITEVDTSQPNSTYQWWTGEYDEYGGKRYNIFTYDENGTTLNVIYYAFTIDKDFEGLISFSKTGAVNPDYVEILEFEDIDTAYNPLHDGFPVTSESTTKSEEYVKKSYLEKPVKTIMRGNACVVSPLNGLKWCALGDSLTDWGGGNCDIGNDADFGFITQIMRETGIIGTNKGYAGGHWTSDANETDGYTASSAVKNVNDIINGNVDYDIVTIAYGTNSDTNGDGTVEDAADQYATMCGAIKWCIEKLITWKPSLQIGIILPPQRADMGTSGNISMRTRGDLIKSVAELYSIPCCDMWRESGINTMTYKTTNSQGEEVDAYYYLSDGLHLGGENRDYNGYKKYGAKLKSFLESIAPVY